MHENISSTSRALALSTCLHHDYMIEGILGEGGFGITYIGRHISTDKLVAIKEYFPKKLAIRTENNSLCSFPGNEETLFLKGRQHFYREANVLMEFQYIDSVVSVYEVFEENNTAYIIMEYIPGSTLEQYINEKGALPFSELIPLFTPVIHALSSIHEKKLIHRDISPDNLILDSHNRLHLIDFGATSPEDITGQHNTIILKAGYAPPEQYIPDSKIGPWIDVYALCATMFFALTGHPPTAAVHRIDGEDISSPLATLTDLLPWQRDVLEQGLHLQPAKRFDNISDLYCALTIPPEKRKAITVIENSLDRNERQKIHNLRIRRRMIPLFYTIAILLVLAGGLLIRYAIKTASVQNKETAPPSHAASSENPYTALPSSDRPDKTIAVNDNTTPDPLLSMPDVSGIPLKQAKNVLKNLDSSITVKTVRVYDNKIKKGWVISQSVAEDAVFSEGHLDSVLLTVSLGRRPKKKATAAPAGTTKSPTEKPQKNSPSDYKVQPDDEDYVTIPLP